MNHKLEELEKQNRSYASLTDRLLRLLEKVTAERDQLRKEKPISCWVCGDGYTPLYCLNCAEKMLEKIWRRQARNLKRPAPAETRIDPREKAAKALGLTPKGEAGMFGHL